MQIIITTDHKVLLSIGSRLNTTSIIARNINSTFAWTNTCINRLISENILEVDTEKRLSNKRIKPLKLTEKGIKIRDLLLELERVTNG